MMIGMVARHRPNTRLSMLTCCRS